MATKPPSIDRSPAALVDSAIFGDMFATEPMRDIFSDAGTIARYLDIEAALAKVQGELGIIPGDAAQVIQQTIARLDIDTAALRISANNVGYPIVGVVNQIADSCPGNAGQYVHWGATTQDIMDTAVVMQIRDAFNQVETALTGVNTHLGHLATEHRDTPMPGRTHLQHALPVSFGYKCAVWQSAVLRHLDRLSEMRARVLQGQFAGAAGTLASLHPEGLTIHEELMRELGLYTAPCPWHAMRDSLAEGVNLIGLISGTLSKIATDVSIMMMTEIGEVSEEYAAERGSSSTMPQKHNPILCEMIIGTGRIVRQNAGIMMEAVCTDFERATGPWHAEWHAIPQVFLNISAALSHADNLLDNLVVHPDRMAANLAISEGGISAEAVMMALGAKIGRKKAYKLIYSAFRDTRDRKIDLAEALSDMPEVSVHLSRQKIDALLAPENYLGHSGDIVDRVQSLARDPHAQS
ncbi:class-II fumarase/aspartase family protein [Roseovarius pelagicus]|uniref:Adenylosuccinate lyase family protein n=1 Tax=Roseovarius pelagicus TaxID=2980108 RepID=A0ABY6D5Q4_9RHOB|nr:adenylosuccinate lyase family protein [Roseovarius pelagicus]UXX81482.1 adenylosuccinate lyase family protein [Roseovarius pelagicus]